MRISGRKYCPLTIYESWGAYRCGEMAGRGSIGRNRTKVKLGGPKGRSLGDDDVTYSVTKTETNWWRRVGKYVGRGFGSFAAQSGWEDENCYQTSVIAD